MNKSVNVNLAGFFFHIDEQAYQKLETYLHAVKRSLQGDPSRDEIMADIEGRIAELFMERRVSENQVVLSSHVDEVIAIMGQPEDYTLDEEAEPAAAYQSTYSSHTPKSLYRDPDNKYISGVSSGLAHYFNVDPVWIRVLNVLLLFITGGSWIFIYLVLWIAMPEARTTSQKLNMHGKRANIDNIKTRVSETMDSVVDGMKNADYDAMGKKAAAAGSGLANTISSIVQTLLTIIVKFIGGLLVLVGATTLIALVIGLFTVGGLDLFGFDLNGFIERGNLTGIPVWLVSLGVLLAIGIPYFALLILGMKLLIPSFSKLGRVTKLSLLALWILSLILLTIAGVNVAQNKVQRTSVTEKVELNLAPTDTLYVRMMDRNSRSLGAVEEYDYQYDYKYEYDQDDTNTNSMIVLGNDTDLDDLDIYVKRLPAGSELQPRIVLVRKARGRSTEVAGENAAAITYDFNMQGNTLSLAPSYGVAPGTMINDQDLEVYITLPVGQHLKLDSNMRRYLSDYGNDVLPVRNMTDELLEVREGAVISRERMNESAASNKMQISMDKEGFSIIVGDENVQIEGTDRRQGYIDLAGSSVSYTVDNGVFRLDGKNLNSLLDGETVWISGDEYELEVLDGRDRILLRRDGKVVFELNANPN